MPNEDKRRRLDGATTTQLSVAELIARREAETEEIPLITDEVLAQRDAEVDAEVNTTEPTVRFNPVRKPVSHNGRELHITELLRREGRGEDASETTGFSVPKLVAAASGGVVLCGTVAFGASNWLSSPDERPLAEVRFDERVQARGSSDNGVVKIPTKSPDQQGTASSDDTEQAQQDQQDQQVKPRVAPYTQQQNKPNTQAPTETRAPQQTTEQQTTEPQAPPSSTTPPSSETPTPPSSNTPSPPTESTSTPPPSSSTPPASTTPSAPVKVDLGILDPVLNPIGNFDFFAPAS